MGRRNPILELSFEFALAIITFCDVLQEQKRFVIAHQLLKSGTSIGANVHEAQSAESKVDFVHKLKIADKEAIETEYWLKLCQASKDYPKAPELLSKLTEIRKLLSTIIFTTKQKIEEENNQHPK